MKKLALEVLDDLESSEISGSEAALDRLEQLLRQIISE